MNLTVVPTDKKRTRTFDAVPIADVDAVLATLAGQGMEVGTALKAAGYSQQALDDARKAGQVKRLVLMALKGVSADRATSAAPRLDLDMAELGELLTMLIVVRATAKDATTKVRANNMAQRVEREIGRLAGGEV